MDSGHYSVRAKVWLYPGMAGWHFVTIPRTPSEKITKKFASRKRGWGSLPVVATIGKTRWKTSIFPERNSPSYILPLKADVRKKEGIESGDVVKLLIEIKA